MNLIYLSLIALSAPPQLVRPCLDGLQLAPDSVCTVAQRDGHHLYTNGLLLEARWCSHDLLNCHSEQGSPCPIDECTHVWSVYACAACVGSESIVRIQSMPGLSVHYWASDPWGHVQSGVLAGPADYNMDGQITSNDLFSFLTAFFDGNADYDLSGATDTSDFFAFVEEFFQ